MLLLLAAVLLAAITANLLESEVGNRVSAAWKARREMSAPPAAENEQTHA